ncbi:MAG: SUMF1/EgtB/PvdO family nonheme iron enzyme [Bacteroidales bacterium]|nr:SUMF1/EgtB/PvdO family nonheme iron enzyme [Bacteroidales bacterium]
MKSIFFKGSIILLMALALFGCKSSKKDSPSYVSNAEVTKNLYKKLGENKTAGQTSSVTDWNFNDPMYGGFEQMNYIDDPNNIGPNLTFIVGGTFVMGTTQDQIMYEWDNVPRRVTVNSFYMDKTEISNFNYLEYLHWLQWVFSAPNTASIGGGEQTSSSATRNWANVYGNALPDTLVWRDPLTYNEPMISLYLRHPAYRDYPVVGVSWEQATEFCIWRSDRVNEQRMIQAGILNTVDLNQRGSDNFNTEAYLAGLYTPAQDNETGALVDLSPNASINGTEGQPRRVRTEDGIFLPNYRLPTEAEWEFAAVGLIGDYNEENISNRNIYPWRGNFTRLEGENMGQFADNFKRGRGDYMGISGQLNDGAAFTAPVQSFLPNDFGLYNMAGNVSEWVMDVYRPLTFEDMNDISSFRGNLYKTIDESKAGETDELGRRIYRNVDVEKDNLAARRNYRKSDYINYLDGDFTSQKRTDWNGEPNDNSVNMYNSEGENPTSLISDKSRVYKGGSWNDRAFYISPGARRFLDQDRSSACIGFRCAMDRVGTAVIGQTF